MKLKRHINFVNSLSDTNFLNEKQEVYISNPTVGKGERIEMIKMEDDPAPIEPGTKGVVDHIDGIGQIHIHWDNGRMLAIVPEIDKFKLIIEKKSSYSDYQTYFKGKLDEFEVKSPTDLDKKQWNDIEAHWHSKYGTDYSKYFKAKLKEFKADNMSNLTKKQWKEIDNGWVSKDEKK